MSGEVSERGLLDVQTFVLPTTVLARTVEFLRHVGAAGFEAFALWSGTTERNDVFRFQNVFFPEQKPSRTEHGLMVVVDGSALFQVNKTAFERGETVAGQVHTHPSAAYHSELDDSYPLVTLLGSLSVVIPDFARDAPRDIDEWAWYRLVSAGCWEPIAEQTEIVIE